MADAKHTSTGDTSFRASVVRAVAGSLALVVGVAALFWAIGSIGRADDPRTAGSSNGEPTADGGDEDGEDPAAGDDGAPDDAGAEEPVGEDGEPGDDAGGDDAGDGDPADGQPDDGGPAGDEPADDGADDEPADGEPADDEPADGDPADDEPADGDPPDDEPADEGPADDEPADDAPSDEEPPGPSLEPGNVTVQVLDGYQQDGGSAAAQVADELRGAGYQVVAENPALRYEVTTVLWTEGNEAAARQVAQVLGADEVRAQPGNLSESVMVHVVVGADRA